MPAVTVRTVTLRSGLRLPCAETGRPGSSLPVVWLHAYVESWRYVEPVLSHLPPSIHSFAPTQRGHPSVVGDPAGYRVSDFASDVVDLLDAVGVARAVLVGTSSGGLVAQAVASGHPERVAGLVLVSSPATLADKPGVDALRAQVMTLTDPVDPGFVEHFVRSTSPVELPEGLAARLVEESLAIPATVWRQWLSGLLEPVRQEPVRIDVPALLLCGSADPLVRDDQQVLLDRMPDAELVVYEAVGHSPHLAHPQRVAADVAGFVQRRWPMTAAPGHPR